MSGMGRWRWWAVAAAALLCAGCAGGSGPGISMAPAASTAATASAAPTASRPFPTVGPYPVDVPLSGHNLKPGEKPPLYPATARARTQEGASAFAEFYLRTLDWAFATTNSSYLKHYSGPSCGLCGDLATGVTKTAAARHWYLGGRLTIHAATATPIGAVTAPADFCAIVKVDITAQSVVDRAGTVLNDEAAHPGLRWKVCAQAARGQWHTTYFAGVK